MKKLLYLLLFIPFGVFGQTQTVNVGTTANDHTGDPLRTAFQKVNTNFSAVRDSFGNIYRESQTKAQIRDTLNARIAAALPLGDYAFLKADANTAGEAVTLEYLQSYIGGGSGINRSYLQFIVGTTSGAPNNGDTSLTHASLVGKEITVYRGTSADLHKQYFNNGLTYNAKTGYCIYDNSLGKLRVRPAFSTGDRVFIVGEEPINVTWLYPTGADGGGGGGGSVLLDSLISVWEMNETSGTSFSDIVGGSTATGYSTTPNQTGKLGIGVKIGYEGAVVIPYASRLAPQADRMSMSAWFKIDTLPSVSVKNNFLINFRDTYGTTHAMYISYTDNKLWGQITNSDATPLEYYVVSAATVTTGVWHHAALVCGGNGRALSLYLDGTKSTGNTFTGTLHAINGNITLGNDQNGYPTNLRGTLDQVGYWYQRLMPADIVLLYNSGNGRAHPFN